MAEGDAEKGEGAIMISLTQRDVLEAVAEHLRSLWPDKAVYANEIPQHVDGSFFVHVVEAGYTKLLDRRREIDMMLDVSYFLASNDSFSYHDWQDEFMRSIRLLKIKGVRVHCRNIRADLHDRIAHVTFGIRVQVLEPEPEEEAMTELDVRFEKGGG